MRRGSGIASLEVGDEPLEHAEVLLGVEQLGDAGEVRETKFHVGTAASPYQPGEM